MDKPCFLVIGAGSRGIAYAEAVNESGIGLIAAIAEPIKSKRERFASQYIWPFCRPHPDQEFDTWEKFVSSEIERQQIPEPKPKTISGVFVCVQDELHAQVVTALAPLGIHIMSEKPLATTLEDCLRIQESLQSAPKRIFAIGHVLRYSPHNMLLRHLIVEKGVIGDILSMEHTEPVGWWHFSHSYVRGNWRKQSKAAPSLLTKSCHDIDFILWMLCNPTGAGHGLHLPSRISSAGSLRLFQRPRKLKAAGNATNCMTCPISESCRFSAPRIYYDKHLAKGHAQWPVNVVNPDIESIAVTAGLGAAKDVLFRALAEDYDASRVSEADVSKRPWYGRCVWECDNDVCDDQFVTLEWDDKRTDTAAGSAIQGAKTASFHMVASTLAQCERRGRIYGTEGEVHYDSKEIVIHQFSTDSTETFHPEVPQNSHHGGGDYGLTLQFLRAVVAFESGELSAVDSQREFMGCTLEDVIRSHAIVFAAEEARQKQTVISWSDWWEAAST